MDRGAAARAEANPLIRLGVRTHDGSEAALIVPALIIISMLWALPRE
jgi:hypothetical protein